VKKVIRFPLLTEKTSAAQSGNNHYVFVVDVNANKFEIKREVEALKKSIKVESVRTMIIRGKMKRMGAYMGKRSNFKKAIVKLKAGQTLELFETAV